MKMHLSDFLLALQAEGKYIFSSDDARYFLGCSSNALRIALHRNAVAKRIVSIGKKLFLIIPPEYQSMGSPPPDWYIDRLLCYRKIPYYVGLLTAAAYHGASHQQPQIYQVVVPRPLRSLQIGRSHIRFYTSKRLTCAKTVTLKSPNGYFKVSTPEQTALDLVIYYQECGYLSHVATVLSELEEKIDPDKLIEIAEQKCSSLYLQRLGFLLEKAGGMAPAQALKEWLKSQKLRYQVLRPDIPLGQEPIKDKEWKLMINDEVDVDEW